jgi:hypothetical protein
MLGVRLPSKSTHQKTSLMVMFSSSRMGRSLLRLSAFAVDATVAGREER